MGTKSNDGCSKRARIMTTPHSVEPEAEAVSATPSRSFASTATATSGNNQPVSAATTSRPSASGSIRRTCGSANTATGCNEPDNRQPAQEARGSTPNLPGYRLLPKPISGEIRGRPMELLTAKEVARRLRVSTSLIYQLIESGRLGCHRIGNGRGAIRIPPEDVANYLQSCREDPCGNSN